MKFLMTYQGKPDAPPPSPDTLAALGRHTAEMVAKKILILTGGLVRPSRGVHVQCKDGRCSVIDGPYAETKELIDGFALVEAASRDEAIALAFAFMKIAGDGTGEILQVFETDIH